MVSKAGLMPAITAGRLRGYGAGYRQQAVQVQILIHSAAMRLKLVDT